jgi:6-pyruvoyl-tetrahydropterin synthase
MKLFVEHLTVIDSAYLCAKRGIVGESWIVDITLHGDLDPQSMVMDFGRVKKQIKAAIDGSVDHTLIVPARHAALHQTRNGDALALRFTLEDGSTLEHHSPAQAVTLLDAEQVSTAALTAWLQAMLMQHVPGNVSAVEVALRHEDDAPTHYHYAHGLKKHDGNCQRIAHGHRSRIMVWENEVRSPAYEQQLAARMRDRYLATQEDLVAQKDGMLQLAYTSPQGHFALHYPVARCHVLPTDTTVECIAQWLADGLKAAKPEAHFRVRAYEGVHKGAIGEA